MAIIVVTQNVNSDEAKLRSRLENSPKPRRGKPKIFPPWA
jgi:hypothetical protein